MSSVKKLFLASIVLCVLTALIPCYSFGAVKPPQVIPSTKGPNLTNNSNLPSVDIIPEAPGNLKAVGGYGRITLTWEDNSSAEEGFLIERGANDEFIVIDRVGANATTYTDTGAPWPLNPNEEYCYRVKAYRGRYESEGSNIDYAYYYTEEPMPAYNLKAEPLSYDKRSFRLTWEIPNNLDTKYYLETSVKGGLYKTGSNYTSPSATIDKEDLTVGIPYSYRIKAVNGLKKASYSNSVSVTIPHLPAPPVDFKAVTHSSTSIKLTWVDKADNEDGFKIFRKKLGENSYQNSFTVGSNVQEYVVIDLEAAAWYNFGICPFNGNDIVMASYEIKGRTAPREPFVSAACLSDNTVQISCLNHTKVTQVNIERKQEGGEWVLIKEYIMFPPNLPESFIYNDTTVSPGTTYTYRCFAVLLDGSEEGPSVSAPSNETTVSTSGGLTSLIPNPLLTGARVIRLNLGKMDYKVGDQTLTMDTAPVINEDRVMLPIRHITDALGASLAWDGQSQKVTISMGETTVELWIGSNTAMVNGAERMIDPANPNVRPFIAPPGRTMLPLRFISESLGCTVNWNAELQEASIEF